MNIDNRYGQPTRGRRDELCQEFQANGGDVGVLIDRIEKGLRLKPKMKSGGPSKREIKGKYTFENINKEIESNRVPNSFLHDTERVAKNKELYQWSLGKVQEYEKNVDAMNDHDQFCLNLFKARMSSHLNQKEDVIRYSADAFEAFKRAMANGEVWAEKIDVAWIERKFKWRELIKGGPLLKIEQEKAPSAKNILLSKTYVDLSQVKDVEAIKELFKDLEVTDFSRLVLELNALDALEYDRFAIFFEKLTRGAGVFNLHNRIQINIDSKSRTLFHELMHKAMIRTFPGNATAPYKVGDVEAQKAYRECMRQTLLNLVDAICPIDILAKLKCNKDYEIEHAGCDDLFQFFRFPHPWSKEMSLDQLVDNCFLERGFLECIGTAGKEKMKLISLGGTRIIKIDEKEIKVESGKPEYSMPIGLIEKAVKVFGKTYGLADLDTEFITNFIDFTVAVTDHKYVDYILKPLMDYIEKYVVVEMKKYIEGHPRKG